MPDIYEVQGPGGTYEIQSDHAPSAAEALGLINQMGGGARPVTVEDIFSGRVGRDKNLSDEIPSGPREPGTWWGGFIKSISDQAKEATAGNEMVQRAAFPTTTGDMLTLVMPSGALSLPSVGRNLGGQLRTIQADAKALENAGGATSTFGSRLLKMPANYYQAFKDRMTDPLTNADRAFQRAPLARQMESFPQTPAPIEPRGSMPPVATQRFNDRPLAQQMDQLPQTGGTGSIRSGMAPPPNGAPFNELPLYQQMDQLPQTPAPMAARGPAPPLRVAETPVAQAAAPNQVAPQSFDLRKARPNHGPASGRASFDELKAAVDRGELNPSVLDAYQERFGGGSGPGVTATPAAAPPPPVNSPLRQPRIDRGAEPVGRGVGKTKEQVRAETGPILGEQQGAASPIFPQKTLTTIIDTMRKIPPGAEREAYVARATSGKAQWQVENIRRTLEHLGLLAPLAFSPMRDALLSQMSASEQQTP